MKIIIDTNFLMIPAQFGIDIFTEIERITNFKHEICVLGKTMKELEKIMQEQKGKHKRAAKLAKQIVESKKIKIIETNEEGSVDQTLIKMAEKAKIAVATQDKLLRARLKEKGAYLIGLRHKTRLFVDKNYNL